LVISLENSCIVFEISGTLTSEFILCMIAVVSFIVPEILIVAIFFFLQWKNWILYVIIYIYILIKNYD